MPLGLISGLHGSDLAETASGSAVSGTQIKWICIPLAPKAQPSLSASVRMPPTDHNRLGSPPPLAAFTHHAAIADDGKSEISEGQLEDTFLMRPLASKSHFTVSVVDKDSPFIA